MAPDCAVKLLLLHGPNLNLLGEREPEHYGTFTLMELERYVTDYARNLGIEVACAQSNSEGSLIDAIHEARQTCSAIIFNPGAYTHYSYALYDAVRSISIPVVEVHLSDIMAREEFRRISVIAPACVAQIYGRGIDGYCDAVDILAGSLLRS